MPTYTVRRANSDSNHTWEVFCSYTELQEMCEEYNLQQVLSAPKIVSGVGSLATKTDDGWKDHLKRIKQNSGRGNTIKV
jgi:hypothetical protein